jgi:hypothetical protein
MGKILKDEMTLNDYKIVDGSKMALIVRKTPAGSIQKKPEAVATEQPAVEAAAP